MMTNVKTLLLLLLKVSNTFIVSLATADLIVGLVVMPIGAVYIFSVDWRYGVVVCQLWMAVDYTASTASILNLLILSLDRYWSVVDPLRYLHRRTHARAAALISTAWLLSSLWILPIVFWHRVFSVDGRRQVPETVCDVEYADNAALKAATAILNYYLPLGVMLALYAKIYAVIRRRFRLENATAAATTSVATTAGSGAAVVSADTGNRFDRCRLSFRLGRRRRPASIVVPDSSPVIDGRRGCTTRARSTNGKNSLYGDEDHRENGDDYSGDVNDYEEYEDDDGDYSFYDDCSDDVGRAAAEATAAAAVETATRDKHGGNGMTRGGRKTAVRRCGRWAVQMSDCFRRRGRRQSDVIADRLRQVLKQTETTTTTTTTMTTSMTTPDEKSEWPTAAIPPAEDAVELSTRMAFILGRSASVRTCGGIVGDQRGGSMTSLATAGLRPPISPTSSQRQPTTTGKRRSASVRLKRHVTFSFDYVTDTSCRRRRFGNRISSPSSQQPSSSSSSSNQLQLPLSTSGCHQRRLRYRNTVFSRQRPPPLPLSKSSSTSSSPSSTRRMPFSFSGDADEYGAAESSFFETPTSGTDQAAAVVSPAERRAAVASTSRRILTRGVTTPEVSSPDRSSGCSGDRSSVEVARRCDVDQLPAQTLTARSGSTKRRSMAFSREVKAARQLGVIMGAFMVCFCPYFVCFVVVAICPGCVDARLMTTVTWIGYLNSTLNPFLYPLCNIHFRRKFAKMLRMRGRVVGGGVDRRRTRDCSVRGTSMAASMAYNGNSSFYACAH